MTDTDSLQLLEDVLNGTGTVVEGVDRDQWSLPTPCTEMDVEGLLAHIVGWMGAFAAAVNEETPTGDPNAHELGDDPVGEYRHAADRLIEGWEAHGFDRTINFGGGETPAPMAFNMTVMEYLTHGWDLAAATGQASPWSEAVAENVLALAKETLPPEYQGAGMAFGTPVPVDDDAPAIDRLVAFLGRNPEHPLGA